MTEELSAKRRLKVLLRAVPQDAATLTEVRRIVAEFPSLAALVPDVAPPPPPVTVDPIPAVSAPPEDPARRNATRRLKILLRMTPHDAVTAAEIQLIYEQWPDMVPALEGVAAAPTPLSESPAAAPPSSGPPATAPGPRTVRNLWWLEGLTVGMRMYNDVTARRSTPAAPLLVLVLVAALDVVPPLLAIVLVLAGSAFLHRSCRDKDPEGCGGRRYVVEKAVVYSVREGVPVIAFYATACLVAKSLREVAT